MKEKDEEVKKVMDGFLMVYGVRFVACALAPHELKGLPNPPKGTDWKPCMPVRSGVLVEV